LPPYVITATELNTVYDVVGEALEIVAKSAPFPSVAR
jgi:adenosylmethionine-8-amino-7-oxononanoate aminotransferase